jgi:hypothetical protein
MDRNRPDATTGKAESRDPLEAGIQYLKGVGPKRAEMLGKNLTFLLSVTCCIFSPINTSTVRSSIPSKK